MMHPGRQIGPYVLVEELGRGAFGVVWLAEKRTSVTTTRVALKIPLHLDIDLATLKREADIWVQASGHPNVLPLVDADIYDDVVVIASEYAPSGSLQGWLRHQGGAAPSTAVAVDLMTGILAGLEHLHARHIIHRDLKPANILLQGQIPRLADFGLARPIRVENNSLTISGTPRYMSPESLSGIRNELTDLWSAAVIFYQMLTGCQPFDGNNIYEILKAIHESPVELPERLPAAIKHVLARALDKDPSNRYRSASEMLIALRCFRDEIASLGVGEIRDIGDGALGHGIRIGGIYRGKPLRVVAGNWVKYGEEGWVRSGWLYEPDRSPHFAELFYKIHLNADGTGYVHLNSSANPSQIIGVETGVEVLQEFELAWSLDPLPRSLLHYFLWEREEGPDVPPTRDQ
jgi:serine/threonine protein kinase